MQIDIRTRPLQGTKENDKLLLFRISCKCWHPHSIGKREKDKRERGWRYEPVAQIDNDDHSSL